MIGTLIGLINMLDQLNDPSAIGPAMAVALVQLLRFNCCELYNPVANKLKIRTEEVLLKEVMIEGLLHSGWGKPKNYRREIKAFLSPTLRDTVKENSEGETKAGE